MSYVLQTIEKIGEKHWDAFVLSQPMGSIHQVSHWKAFQEKIPGRDQVLGYALTEGEKILISCLCVKRDTGFRGTFWFYSPRGPVMAPDTTQEVLDCFLDQVSQKLSDSGALFWRMDPFLTDQNPLQLSHAGKATQEYQPTDSLVLDIGPGEEDILAQMKRKGRYNINLARKKEITIEITPGNEVTPAMLETFWTLQQETTDRDRFSGHPKEYYQHFLQSLPGTVLGQALFQGTPIAAVINTHCGKKAIYYFGVSSSDPAVRPLMAPYLLQWEMIRYAKAQGCTSYDFTGITPENQPDHPYKGITQFKLKFGGSRHTYRPGRERVFRRSWYYLYRSLKWLKRKMR